MSNIDTFLLFDVNSHASFKNDVHYFSCKMMSYFNQFSTFESIILFIDAKICKVFIWSILHCQRSSNDIKALKKQLSFHVVEKGVYTEVRFNHFVIKSCFSYLPIFVIRAFLHLTDYFFKNALFVFYFNISI